MLSLPTPKLSPLAAVLLGVCLLIGAPGRCSAQSGDNFISNLVVNNIYLKEKQNTRMQVLPKYLIEAYGKGMIQGYYPNTIDMKMPFEAFAANIPNMSLREDQSEFACCSKSEEDGAPALNYETLKTVEYPGFDFVVQLIETEAFNKASSTQTYKTHAIRLIWKDPNGQLRMRNAVLFKMEEIKTALDALQVPHSKNEAARLSMLDLITQRDFKFRNIEVNGRPLMTKEELAQRQRARYEDFHNLWER